MSTLLTNLVSYWKLDESSGNATDSVGSNTLTNTNTATFVAGKINNGVNLVKASSQRLSITNDLGITSGAISFSGWIYLASDPGSGTFRGIFSKGDTGTHVDYFLRYNNDAGTKLLKAGRAKGGVANQEANYTVTLSTSTWYHVVYTYDGSTITLYLNGTSVATASASGDGTIDIADHMLIGAVDNSNTTFAPDSLTYWDGIIDEAGIWSRALTAPEVTALYNSGSGIAYPFSGTGGSFLPFL